MTQRKNFTLSLLDWVTITIIIAIVILMLLSGMSTRAHGTTSVGVWAHKHRIEEVLCEAERLAASA